MLDNKGNMYVEEDDIIELLLLNKQAKILPRNIQSFKTFESTCKTYGITIFQASATILPHFQNGLQTTTSFLGATKVIWFMIVLWEVEQRLKWLY